jgi:hypothetical protein
MDGTHCAAWAISARCVDILQADFEVLNNPTMPLARTGPLYGRSLC